MSGLYNMVFGVDELAGPLLVALNLAPKDVPRLRDVFVVKDPTAKADAPNVVILIYTRTGGGNRAHYDAPNADNMEGPWNSTMRTHPLYMCDMDDEFDSTYAKFYFKLPPELEEYRGKLFEIARPSPEERWKMSIEAMKGPTV